MQVWHVNMAGKCITNSDTENIVMLSLPTLCEVN